MAHRLLDSQSVIQVFGPNLASEAIFCTFQSFPSGSVLIRTVPQDTFIRGDGGPLVETLAEAVENLLSAEVAIAAAGTQGLDASNLIFDAVTFTVEYVPTYSTPGRILGDVQIDVRVITADQSLLGGSGAENAAQLINDEYSRLKALAGE